MPDSKIIPEAVFEVVEPEGGRSVVQVTRSPFLIGRGTEGGNPSTEVLFVAHFY